jgi:murein DD-endopeptidase MepM/ murein hydrolase activator NlpD
VYLVLLRRSLVVFLVLGAVMYALLLMATPALPWDPKDDEEEASATAGFNAAAVPKAYQKYIPLIMKAGSMCEWVSPALIAAQIEQESSWNHLAVSPANAKGLSQFIDPTWRTWGKNYDDEGNLLDGPGDQFDPADAIMAQGAYDCALARQMAAMKEGKFKQCATVPAKGEVKEDVVKLMLAAYNSGPCAVAASKGVSRNAETQGYVPGVLSKIDKYQKALEGSSPSVEKVIKFAEQQLGKPYVWGAETPNEGFDCSGLVQYSFKKGASISLPRVAKDQAKVGQEISWSQKQRGDVIAFSIKSQYDHIGIYLGDGMMIHAPRPGKTVEKVALAGYYDKQSPVVRRYITASTGGGGGSGKSGAYAKPTSGGVGTGYHVPGSMWSKGYHTGIDFPVTNKPVYAVSDGEVVSSGMVNAYGNEIIIRLPDGKYAQYAHLSSRSVKVGDKVKGGQQIGVSGNTGNTSGPHLHFEIRTTQRFGSDINPLTWLRSHGVRI